MRKVLIVGYISPFDYKKMAEKYTDTLFIREESVQHFGSYALIELVGMFNAVLFANYCDSERLTYEVACAMKNIKIEEMSAYPLEEEKSAVEELSDTAKQIIVDTMRMPS